MPYYVNKHLLFIHIPKTGGTNIETCLKQNDKQKLISGRVNDLIPDMYLKKVSLQHQTYSTIYKYRELLGINFDEKLRIMATVRNPYTRIISDLFHFKVIIPTASPEQVRRIIKKYTYCRYHHRLDNHSKPQYEFITDENGELIKNITILKTETLNEDFKEYLGLTLSKPLQDPDRRDYYTYLNADSINIINETYKKDFELFGYQMIIPDSEGNYTL